MRYPLLFISVLLLPVFIIAQNKVTVSGYVTEKGSKEFLPGVTVYHPESDVIAFTNNYGFYSITVPKRDTTVLFFSVMGFAVDTFRLSIWEDHTLNVDLNPVFVLDAVSVVSEKQNSQVVQMSSVKITPMEVKKLPALFGEKDVFKTLLLMPGVQSASEGTSGIYVRGGGADQNLIILDEAIIYNASHLLGFFSIFNGDAIRSVELIKGGFPARYGGRLSSVIDVKMKEGNKSSYHGEGGIGLISSHIMVEGPIVKDKASFMFSARRTYFDILARPVLKLVEPGLSVGYFFFDLNGKINYDFGDKDKLFVSGYWGRDKFYMNEKWDDEINKVGLYWQNGTASVRWNHIFSNKLFSNLSFIFNDYKMDIYNKYIDPDYEYHLDFNSGIRDYALKADLIYNLNNTHTFLMGAMVTLHQARPNAYVIKEDNDKYSKVSNAYGLESALYFEDEINIRNRLKINPGLRAVLFSVQGKSYFLPEPRLGMSYNIKKNLAVKASYAMMNQYMLLLSSSTIGLPTDLWVPVTRNIKPQRSQQVALGIAYDWQKPRLSFSLEGYYKKLDHIIGYKEGASFLMGALEGELSTDNSTWESKTTSGQGWAYGMEFLVRRNVGKVTGWVGYTLSWIQHQFDELNYGKKFYARYDRRHDISVVLMYSPTKRINLSLSWVYATGNAVTLTESIYLSETMQEYYNEVMQRGNQYPYSYSTGFIENYGEKNNIRMRAFHHLDVSAQFIKPHKKGRFESIFEVSVYNIYNHRNPFFYYIRNETVMDEITGETEQVYKLKQLSIFPIIPSFTYHFKF